MVRDTQVCQFNFVVDCMRRMTATVPAFTIILRLFTTFTGYSCAYQCTNHEWALLVRDRAMFRFRVNLALTSQQRAAKITRKATGSTEPPGTGM